MVAIAVDTIRFQATQGVAGLVNRFVASVLPDPSHQFVPPPIFPDAR